MSDILKSPFLAKIVAVLAGFTAFAALGGAGAALPEAVNKTAILEPLRGLPWSAFFFSDMTWPRVFLVTIIGLPQVLALVLTVLRRPRAWLAVTVSGGILLGWMAFGAAIYGIGSEVTAAPVMIMFTAIAIAELALPIVGRNHRVQDGLAAATAAWDGDSK
jgi:hypothetical protein